MKIIDGIIFSNVANTEDILERQQDIKNSSATIEIIKTENGYKKRVVYATSWKKIAESKVPKKISKRFERMNYEI